jgi:dihydroorotate dehydrogenase
VYGLAKSVLFELDAERAHHLGIMALKAMGPLSRTVRPADDPVLATTVAGLRFPNPVGLAAGLDKNAEAVTGLFGLGFGFVEIGTVTPKAQPGNPKPRLFRLLEHEALINRLGFNNEGADAVAKRLTALTWRPGPIGVNLGKNKDTPLEHAVDDYVSCAKTLAPLGDYVVVNLSSPNTPGLRQLQEPEVLERLLQLVRQTVTKPLFLKIAPDLGDEAVDAVVDVARGCAVDGLICTNTTIGRPVAHALAGEVGGLSGKPLRQRSTEVVRRAFVRTQGTLPIIGVGGVFTVDDAWEKISAGASLVQIYSGFIYGGPGLPAALCLGLAQRATQAGLPSISAAVGRNA